VAKKVQGKKETIWTYNFTALFITNCVMFFGQFMMSTLLPKYLSSLNISSSVIGVVVGMFSVTALGTRPVTGPLIDGCNKKKLYMLMLCFIFVADMGYAAVSSVALLCVFRLLHGIGMGCNAALALTMATDALPESKVASGIGVYGMSSVLATAFGPGIGLAIAGKFGYKVAFLISGALVFISIIIASRMKIEKNPDSKIVFRPDNIVAREAIVPAFFLLLSSIARAGMTTYLVIYITEAKQIDGITVYYIINAAALLISRPLSGKMSDKLGIHKALVPSYVAFAANLILLAFCQNTWQLWICAVLNAFGTGTTQTMHQALVMKVVPANHRGAGSTTAYIGIDIGDLTGPMICGALIERVSYGTMYLLCLIPLAVCAAALLSWVKAKGGIPEPAAVSAEQ
jgi:MFS family permease